MLVKLDHPLNNGFTSKQSKELNGIFNDFNDCLSSSIDSSYMLLYEVPLDPISKTSEDEFKSINLDPL